MGRLAGFLSGTILTLTTTHLLTRRMQRDFSHNSHTLRESTLIADSVLLPRVPITPLRARIERPSLVETMKDTWNREVEGAVRWVQGWDLVAAREGVERVGGRVGGRVWRELRGGLEGGR